MNSDKKGMNFPNPQPYTTKPSINVCTNKSPGMICTNNTSTSCVPATNQFLSHDLANIEQEVNQQRDLHRTNKTVYNVLNQAINIPLLITTTLIASTANAPINFNLPCSGNPPTHVTLTAQVLGVIGSILAALNTFIQPAMQAQQHASSEQDYEEVETEILQLRALANTETPKEVQFDILRILDDKAKADVRAPAIVFNCTNCCGGSTYQ